MTPQAIFDTVTEHLFTQGRASISGPNCLYRGPDGTRCAAGILIPDEIYDKSMEGATIDSIVLGIPRSGSTPHKFPEWFTKNVELISELQHAHDQIRYSGVPVKSRLPFTVDYLNERLGEVASSNDLIYVDRTEMGASK